MDPHSSSLAALSSSSVAMHRANLSMGSTLSSGAVLDEAAFRELDQVPNLHYLLNNGLNASAA